MRQEICGKRKNDDTAAPVPVRISAITCYSELFPCFLLRHSLFLFICKSVRFIIDTRVRDKEIQIVVPLGLLNKMLLSCSNVFFVRPPWRTNNVFTFFIFRRGRWIIVLRFLSSAAAEKQFLHIFYLPPGRKMVSFSFYYLPPRRKTVCFLFFVHPRHRKVFLFHRIYIELT